jgi:hypothetical protein
MPKQISPTPLAARLTELHIEPSELAALVRRPVEDVQTWLANGPDPEGAILTRFLADDADATRRVEQLRRKVTRKLAGEGAERAGVSPPYASGDRTAPTGEGWQ